MRNIKQINIKNRTYYFFNDTINIKNLEPKYKNIFIQNIDLCRIGSIKNIGDYKNIHSVNPLLVKQMDTLKKLMEINT